MSRSFDYQKASVEDIAVRLHTIQRQSFNKLIAYYTIKDDVDMLAKLRQASDLSTILKLQARYDTTYNTSTDYFI